MPYYLHMSNLTSHEQMNAMVEQQLSDIETMTGPLEHFTRTYVAACLRLTWMNGRASGFDDARAIWKGTSHDTSLLR